MTAFRLPSDPHAGDSPECATGSPAPRPVRRPRPRTDGPRERLLRLGGEALSDAELLAVFVRTGLPGRSALTVAQHALDEFGGLARLLDAGPVQLSRVPGFGHAKVAAVHAGLELGRRYLAAELRHGERLTSPTAVRQFLRARLARRPHEVFAALFLDNRHRVIRFEELFNGTIDAATVHPREVVRKALAANAAAVIFAHNHPSGSPEPSAADRRLTRRLVDALGLLEIRVLDHFVVGDGDPVSFAERGLM
ncbi:MAG: DNA repair protein RadC [Pseudomonadota bacterium]